MAYFHSQTRIWIPVLCRDFSIGSDSDYDPLIEMYVTGTRDLSLGQRFIPEMGTVPIWERDLNLNLSQWKHVPHNTM